MNPTPPFAALIPGAPARWALSLGLFWFSAVLHGAGAEPDSQAVTSGKLPAAVHSAIDYTTDIQPILENHCYSCHGPKKQKSGLRLDIKADALAGGDTGKVILPGNSAESVLIHNVTGIDPDMIMPPEDDPLSTVEIAKLRAWIDAGAIWPEDDATPIRRSTDHWAFKAPQRSAPPAVKDQRWLRNPIDAFVLARLEQENVAPSPKADRVTLLRRLSLDLLGLPPTPEDVACFLDDAHPDAYERLVDRLLASPHFGERWGRRWLDLARYADSDGYEKDNARPYAYLFRDWVIDAVNRDLPFDQFTIEQLAGDLLPNATEEQLIATGFHRQTLTNREGGIDKEEFRTKATVDRVSTTGTAWLGLTIGCAECHTHKFDPITQREFYQLYAFFNNASEKDVPAPRPSELAEYTRSLQKWEARQAEFDPPMQALLAGIDADSFQAWEDAIVVPPTRWTVLKPTKVTLAKGNEEARITPAGDSSISPRKSDSGPGRFVVEALSKAKRITGFRLDALRNPGEPVGRGESGAFALAEFRVRALVGDKEPQVLEFASARADFASADGKAGHAMDGDPATAWAVTAQTNQAHVIVFELKEPLEGAEGAKLIFEIVAPAAGLMSRFRLGITTSEPPLRASTVPDPVLAILKIEREQRTAEQQGQLARFYIEQSSDEGQTFSEALTAHALKKPKYPDTSAAILVAEERTTNIHIRGDFLRPGDEVQPGTLGVLHPFRPRGEKPDRLDLANWLVDPENPLNSRVTVNHVWKHLFGRALVTSVDDFGTRGEPPSHPELLDWLALTFSAPRAEQAADNHTGLGWSRKALIKLIVTSAAYRQASVIRPELEERDPNNVLLARQNRFRLEAETVRDLYLATSGLLNPKIGGPSIRPRLPADIAALGYASSMKWPESKDGEQHRRGLYIFFQRTVPYPMLMTFDAPDSNTSCARREVSNTPLQALTLLNDPVFVECAQVLGKRMATGAATTDERIRRAFQACLARPPGAAELNRLREFHTRQIEMMRQNPGSAARIAGETDAAQVEEQAAFAALCRVIMNLDEFVTRD